MRLPLLLCALLLMSLPSFAQDAKPKTLDKNAQRIVSDATKDLKSKEVAKRAAALDTLGSVGGVATAPLVIAALKDDIDARVRAAAADALWDEAMKTSVARPALMAALSDPSPDVAGLAAGALGLYDVPMSARREAYDRALTGAEELRVRFMAARALVGVRRATDLVRPMVAYLESQATATFSSGRDSARTALAELAATGDRAAIGAIAESVSTARWGGDILLTVVRESKVKPAGWIDVLVREAGHRSADVRRNALYGMRDMTTDADLNRWMAVAGRLAASDPDSSVRSAAFSTLQLGAAGAAHAQAPAALTAARQDRVAGVRSSAFEALAAIVNRTGTAPQSAKTSVAKSALPEVQAAIAGDQDKDVRMAALNALDALALPAADTATLLAGIATKNTDEALRTRALALLRNRGPEARSVIADVQKLTSDASASVRDMAKSAVEQMSAGSTSPRANAAPTNARGASPAAGRAAASPTFDVEAETRGLALIRARKVEFAEDQFYNAIGDTDVELVQAFLDAGMSASKRFEISRKEAPIAVAVSSRGCSADVRPTSPKTLAVVRLLIARGANAGIADENKHTPLMEAAMNGCDAAVIGALIKAGADVNAKGQPGLTAFELGLWSGHDGLDAIIAAGFRLTAEQAKTYADAYKANPASLAMIKKATAPRQP